MLEDRGTSFSVATWPSHSDDYADIMSSSDEDTAYDQTCRNAGAGSTNLGQSGKSVALVFSLQLPTNTYFMSY
jgi:hypothetical protein